MELRPDHNAFNIRNSLAHGLLSSTIVKRTEYLLPFALGCVLLASVERTGADDRTASPSGAIKRQIGPTNNRMVDERLQAIPDQCPQSMLEEVLESALDARGRVRPGVADAVEIDCNLTLQPDHVVTKRLVMTGPNASGVTIDCNGAIIRGVHWLPKDTIVVRGQQGESGIWRGAENITVRDCKVHGSVRVYGVAVSQARLRRMSYAPDHTQTMQAAGSKNIVFDNLDIEAYGRNPFYVMTGVMRTTLMNSRIRGRSKGVAIYLDAESAENTIRNNDIGVVNSREQIAIDGSARNLIVGNRISGLNNGGIYLYRNCGERGVIRHQGPEDNVIIDNVFYYRRYRGNTPAVWIASRQNNLPGYCDEDEGPDVPNIGSSLDHLDHAYRNVVTRNRFIAREPSGLIRVHGDPSFVFGNIRVSRGGDRRSPCFVANGYPDPILEHGASLSLFSGESGPRCTGRRLSCHDGILRESALPCMLSRFRIGIAPFECRAEGRNTGCAGRAVCPRGTSIAAVKASCNLEYGRVSDAQLARTPWSLASIVKRSDDRARGVCRLGPIDVGEGGSELRALNPSFEFSCREHDRNGGDCHLRGALACRQNAPRILRPQQARW